MATQSLCKRSKLRVKIGAVTCAFFAFLLACSFEVSAAGSGVVTIGGRVLETTTTSGGGGSRFRLRKNFVLTDVEDLVDGKKVVLLKGYGFPGDVVIVEAESTEIAEIELSSSGYFELPVLVKDSLKEISIFNKDLKNDSYSLSVSETEGIVDLQALVFSPKIINIPLLGDMLLVVVRGSPGSVFFLDGVRKTTLNKRGFGFFFSSSMKIISKYSLKEGEASPYFGSIFEDTTKPPIEHSCRKVFSKNLSVGDSGEEVLRLQKFLQKQGYDTGTPDGVFGKRTRGNVSKFQEQYGADVLSPTNLTSGSGEWFAYSRAKANSIECEEVFSPKESKSTEVLLCENAIVAGGFSEGDAGVQIKKIQRYLFIEGFYRHSIDGLFGAKTAKALKRFQDKYVKNEPSSTIPKKPAGIFGEFTRIKMNELICATQDV